MTQKDFILKVPDENRNLKARLCFPQNAYLDKSQLVIIATGLHSHMDKETQTKLAKFYQKSGFVTLQFNFMAHGENKNKSDGDMRDVTLSSGIKDLKTVWDYAKSFSDKIKPNNIVLIGNSYGALVSLIASEQNIISPETMILVAPAFPDKYKPWILPLKLMITLMPQITSKLFNLTPNMIRDFLNNHSKLMNKENMMGKTAIKFFVGSKDKISSYSDIQKWCKIFNSQMPNDVPFVDNLQAHFKIYNGVHHFKIPEDVQNDINKSSLDFILKTHALRLR